LLQVYVVAPVAVSVEVVPLQIVDGLALAVNASIPFTVKVKLQVAVLFEASVTVHVTVVTPILNTAAARVVEPVPVVTPVNA
jgi:hypothetical protein